jgi:class 3 adenylate cyclase
MSGYDLLDRLRKDDNLRTTPVVFLSALTAADRRLASVQSGVDDIISKPFDENELMVRVRNILAARKQHLEVARLKMEKLLRFLPAPIAKALANEDMDERLRTHRCEVTVVFFDLRGFTSFVEDAEPEEQMEVLREYQTRVGKLVDEYEGTLERFTGDSIMVFFNDPFPIARHHERAISMSVAAQKLLGTMQDEWRRHGFTLGVGIGAAIGYATLGMIGHERRQDYAAIGTVTNLAARLCSRAAAGQILIPERLANLIRENATLELLGEVSLAGFHAPVMTYNVLEMKASVTAT